MGMLIDGRWTEQDEIFENGDFKRPKTGLDLAKSKTELAQMAVEGIPAGRYHLIASMSCPWSQRVILLRNQKELSVAIPMQVAGGRRVEGYPVNFGKPWSVPGVGQEIQHLHELYSLSHPTFSGRVTVPVLWDARDRRIISNEGGDLLRFLSRLDSRSGANDQDYYPEALRAEIDELDQWLYQNLTNAAYRAGLAQRQAAYDDSVARVFDSLDRLEDRLSKQRFLMGEVLTVADWLLFPALVRFDIAYHSLFRCTWRRLVDYPNLWAYARDLYQRPGISATVDFRLIQQGYWQNDGETNPHGILPLMPEMNWTQPHDRSRFGMAMIYGPDGEIRPLEDKSLRRAG